MMQANEFSQVCRKFCEHPAPMEGMEPVVAAYP